MRALAAVAAALAAFGCADGERLPPDRGAMAWPPAVPKVVAPRGVDAGGDGRADLLLRQDSGRLLLWAMNGAQVVAQAELGGVGPEWQIVDASGDYDGDRRTDILWRSTSGAVAIWLMDGATRRSATVVDTLDASWQIVDGRGDYDGDGRSDILWRHANGTVAIWRMEGATRTGAFFPATVPAEWRIADGSGDYDGDGRSDILWRNASGVVAIWRMIGADIASATFLPGVGPEWALVDGTGDYDGDRRSDILWRSTSGGVLAWFMNGTVTGTALLGSADASWRVLDAAGDYDGDGRSDILWQDSQGLVLLWTISGSARTGAVAVGSVSPDWRVAAGSGVKAGTIDGRAPAGGGPTGDTVAPVLTITDDAPGTLGGAPVTFTFTFSEPVTGFSPADVEVTSGTRDDASFLQVSAMQWRIRVAPPRNEAGTLRVRVAAGAVRDAADNPNAVAVAAEQPFDTQILSATFDTAALGAGAMPDGSAGDAGPPGTPPPAFSVTGAGVDGGRRLRLRWNQGDADAQVSHYQLLVRTAIGEPLRPLAGGRLAAGYGRYEATVADADTVGYVVRACSASGLPPGLPEDGFRACTDSRDFGATASATYVKGTVSLQNHAFGHAVSLSTDGRRLAVAAGGGGSGPRLYLLRRGGSGWQHEAEWYSRYEDYGGFAESIALSGDGGTLAVASNGFESEPRDRFGAVYVFALAGGGWGQQALLQPPLRNDQIGFGQTGVVAVSGDGGTLAVTGRRLDAVTGRESGFVLVYGRSGAQWALRADLRLPEPYTLSGARVAISADGGTLAVTGRSDTGEAVHLFVRQGSTWSWQALVLPTDTLSRIAFGASLSLSADGSALAVGAGSDAFAPGGRAYVFRRAGATWFQQALLRPSNGRSEDGFGAWVSLSADARRLAVGAPGQDSRWQEVLHAPTRVDAGSPYAELLRDAQGEDSGAAYLFRFIGSGWVEAAFVKAPDAARFDLYGSSVALSGDGRTLAVGAPYEGSSATGINGVRFNTDRFRSGAVYVH